MAQRSKGAFQHAATQRPLQRGAGLILCALAHGIIVFIFL